MPENLDIIRSTSGFLATALGPGWRVNPEFDHSWGAVLEGPDGLSLLLDMSQDGKISITGCAPGGGTFEHTRIGVSMYRGPEAVARDITRRLLPGYRLELASALEERAALEAARERRRVLAQELHAMCAVAEPMREVPGRVYVDFTTVNGESASIDVYSEGKATFSIHGSSPDTLRKLLAAIGGV